MGTRTTAGAARPSGRAIGAVVGLAVFGTLIPIVGWVVGVVLAARCSDWSVTERVVAIVVPLAAMLAIAAVGVTAAGYDIRLSMVGVPIILSLSSAVGGIFLAVRLVAHKRAAEAAQG